MFPGFNIRQLAILIWPLMLIFVGIYIGKPNNRDNAPKSATVTIPKGDTVSTAKGATIINPKSETFHTASNENSLAYKQGLVSDSLLHIYDKFAICATSEVCGNIGSLIQSKNGSAVDMAIATLLCNGVLAPQSMGLGGGFIMQYYSEQERRAYTIASRPTAPSPFNYNRFLDAIEADDSTVAIGVPGEVMGYAVAHESFGKLPWKELVMPTVKICQTGYEFTSIHLYSVQLLYRSRLRADRHMSAMFVNPKNGELYPLGAIIKPPKELCNTLQILANEGPRSFYKGKLAKMVAKDLKEMGSSITLDDISAYETKVIKSETMRIDDYDLHFSPPPSSGHIVAFVMNILRKYKKYFEKLRVFDGTAYHRIAEALKFGFAKRWHLDAQAKKQFLSDLMSPILTNKLANLINDEFTSEGVAHYGAPPNMRPYQEYGTSHVSLLAKNGDAVSVTSSINIDFGVQRTGNRTGLLFNNALLDFQLPGYVNYFSLPYFENINVMAPGRQPMSSMSPIIVTGVNDGRVRLVLGATGGPRIISTLVQLLIRTLWMKQNIKVAMDLPRIHHQLLPRYLYYEYGVSDRSLKQLAMKGYVLKEQKHRLSTACGIVRFVDEILCNADYYKRERFIGE